MILFIVYSSKLKYTFFLESLDDCALAKLVVALNSLQKLNIYKLKVCLKMGGIRIDSLSFA